jgi:hypothetical protein
LSRSQEWDAISFDCENGYYDHWALSYDPYIYSYFHFTDCVESVAKMRADFGQWLETSRSQNGQQLLPVYSAFNGFALYKTSVFIESAYSSDIRDDLFPDGSIEKHCLTIGQDSLSYKKGDCEHRHFHLDAIRRKGARIRISLLSLFGKAPVRKRFIERKTMAFL